MHRLRGRKGSEEEGLNIIVDAQRIGVLSMVVDHLGSSCHVKRDFDDRQGQCVVNVDELTVEILP